MTLRQLQCLCAVIDHGLNLSRAARALHTSQPAVTKMIQALEHELGLGILVRAGTKIVGITEQGNEIVSFANIVLHDVKNLRLAASESLDNPRGRLCIGTTHLQARHTLVGVIQRFAAKCPEIDLTISVSTPIEITQGVASGAIDMGICALPRSVKSELLTLATHDVHRCLIAPAGHPILRKKKLSWVDISAYRLITNDDRFATGEIVERALHSEQFTQRTTMRATDADIMKAFVAAGLGIAVIQNIAFDAKQDTSIRAVNVDHLFPASTTCILLRKDCYLRSSMCEFISTFSPKWSREKIELARASSLSR